MGWTNGGKLIVVHVVFSFPGMLGFEIRNKSTGTDFTGTAGVSPALSAANNRFAEHSIALVHTA
jgi:hypothetical protein